MNVRRSRTERSGFTLLELLVATMAFAIVLAAINAVFYAALRLRNKSVQSLEAARPLQYAVATIRRDLANIVSPGGTLSGALQTVSITNSMGGQASPDFYTARGFIDENSPWSDLQKISYALVPSHDKTAAGMDLVRAVTRNLLSVATFEPPSEQWLLGGVQSVTFTYFDGTQWRAWWDSTSPDPVTGQTNLLPQAIKVQIQLAARPGGAQPGRLAPVELVAPLMVQTQISQTNGASP